MEKLFLKKSRELIRRAKMDAPLLCLESTVAVEELE